MRTQRGWLSIACRVGLALGLTGVSAARAGGVARLEFLGEARLAGGQTVDGMPVGGLSGITYDAERDRYYVVSDDPSGRGPARFFTLEIDLDGGRLDPDAVEIVAATVIQSPTGGPMAKLTVDPEGIALAEDGTLYISSEGQIRRDVAPFVRHFALDGSYLGELSLPEHFLRHSGSPSGPRHNLVFEALALAADQQALFVATENALLQDGPEADMEHGSPSRLLEFDTTTGELQAEYLYLTEPLAAAPSVADGVAVNGLVELLALSDRRLLAMERSFSMGVGNSVRLFEIDLDSATDISGIRALGEIDLATIRPVAKRLLLDLVELDLYLDNLEGMCFGPDLADGRRSLVLVSDDNFNSVIQVGQVLAFAVDERQASIGDVQGASHRSPLEGQWVLGVEGRVAGLLPGDETGFWLEDEEDDGDPATSRGLRVRTGHQLIRPQIGERLSIDGRVIEVQRREDELTTTTVMATHYRRLASGVAAPPPTRIGPGGRQVPSAVVDDDGLQFFEPGFDGLDFWESLEGMRVVLSAPSVTGPTDRYGNLVVAIESRPSAGSHSSGGGLLLRPGDLNPERLVVVWPEDLPLPSMNVGDRFTGDLRGILTYGYGAYRLVVQGVVPEIATVDRESESTDLGRDESRLTIATFNVRNLSARSSADRFAALARQIVDGLGAPDILALQEIQDDSGREDDGTVGAEQTLTLLTRAIEDAGGPRYDYRQIDPLDNRDGGQPGANIRVVFLFDRERVEFTDRTAAATDASAPFVAERDGLRLIENPYRFGATAAAFSGDAEERFSPSRKPLVGEFAFAGQRLFLINLHLSSKSGDSGTFGAIQPPRRRTEDQRSQQARLVSDLVAAMMAADPEVAVVVLGDLNEHEFRTPVRILEATPLANLMERTAAADRYTFVYNGNAQVLDHVLVSPGLAARSELAIDIVHLNADQAESRQASDHDPIVVEIDFDGAIR